MDMNHAKLLNHCVGILDTFDREMMSLDEHINQYLKHYQITEEADQAFLVEVFSGCVRYSTVMKVIVDGYYNKDGNKVLRSEKHLYTVLCYLALFRLDELRMEHYMKFLKGQDYRKMLQFFTFFLDERNLFSWMKDAWEKDYEQDFVQNNIMLPIESWLPELANMLKILKKKIENAGKPKKLTQPPTECRPFSITEAKIRSVPFPEKIPKLVKMKPPPSMLYRTPREFDNLLLDKQTNRCQAEERLMQSSRFQFACANPEKSHKTVEIMNDILMSKEAELDFNRKKAYTLPNFLQKEVPVKLNAATILRDGSLYQKLEDKEMARYKRLEGGARDPSKFLEWQSEMRQRDMDVKMTDIERRRLAGKLSLEEAILAKTNLVKDNKRKVQEMKQEDKRTMKQYYEKKLQEEQEIKQIMENTMQGHKNAKDAKKKLQEYKQKLVQEVNEESRELMKIALEEAECDMRRKMDLIHQIRAAEASPSKGQKLVDLTSTAGMGLLNEMSIAELRERLALLKVSNEEEEELKRDEILASKQSKDQRLLDTLGTISKHRTEQMRAAASKLEKKKGRRLKPEMKDEKLLEMQRQFEHKRSERLREQQNSKIIPNSHTANLTNVLLSQKENLEKGCWEELERSRERTAKLASKSSASGKPRVAKSALMAS